MKKNAKAIKVIAISFTCILMALLIFPFVLILVFILAQYEDAVTEDGMNIGYNKLTKKAFCYGCEAGEKREFTIPDTFEGIPVTMLGGYIGRGFPCPFSLWVDGGEDVYGCHDVTVPQGDEYETIVLTVHIGKNLKELTYIDDCFWGIRDLDPEGETFDVLFKVVYSFTVNEENETFYAEDGRLYYKTNHQLAEEFFYE